MKSLASQPAHATPALVRPGTSVALPDQRAMTVAQRKQQAAIDHSPRQRQQAAKLPSVLPAKYPVVQAKWKNDSTEVQTLADMEAHAGVAVGLVKPGSEATKSLESADVYYVPRAAELKNHITDGSKIPALPEGKHTIGEQHGDATWDNVTSPWPYVRKMRERYKTYEKEGEVKVGTADEAIELQRGGNKRRAANDLALEGHNEYAIGILTATQQQLQGYDVIHDSGVNKKKLFEELYDNLGEVYAAMERYVSISLRIDKAALTAIEREYVRLGGAIAKDNGFALLQEIIGGGSEKVEILGGVREKYGWSDSKLRQIQALIAVVVSELMDIEGFTDAGKTTVDGLNAGRERGRKDWQTLQNNAVVTPAIRDAREREMVRRINAGPTPLLVQVGEAHIPGLRAKGAAGTLYTNFIDFSMSPIDKSIS